MAVMFELTKEMLGRSTTENTDDPSRLENHGPRLLGTVSSLLIIMIIVMVIRIYCRAFVIRKMGCDDWCMILAAIFGSVLAIVSLLGVKSGNGRHQETLTIEDGILSHKLGWVGQICYFLSLGFCKASLLLLVIRLTPSERMVTVCWSVLGFSTAFTIASVIVSFLQCIPVSYYWNQADPRFQGTVKGVCMNQKAMQSSLPAINIATDLIVWLLPIKMVWNIRLPPREKCSLVAVFSLGGLGVLSGVLRLHTISIIDSKDVSWDYLSLIIWSNVEVLISISCGSAPVAKPFFFYYLPSFLGISGIKSNNHPDKEPSAEIVYKSKSRSRQNAIALSSISNTMSVAEHSSTEEFGVASGSITAKCETSSRGDAESGEFHDGVEGGSGGSMKVTDVEIFVEESV